MAGVSFAGSHFPVFGEDPTSCTKYCIWFPRLRCFVTTFSGGGGGIGFGAGDFLRLPMTCSGSRKVCILSINSVVSSCAGSVRFFRECFTCLTGVSSSGIVLRIEFLVGVG